MAICQRTIRRARDSPWRRLPALVGRSRQLQEQSHAVPADPDEIPALFGGGHTRPGPAQRHILHLMPDPPPDAAWLKLGAEPGLCGACRHAKLTETRRSTVYLRCTRAAWDTSLSRYPRLPVTQCGGFDREEKP